MAYKPIESYGVIGDMYSLALVGTDGSIDWCCLPRFDSPSVFGAILDDQIGGFFKIASAHDETQFRQMYLPETNILITRFLSPDGVGETVDFMPVTAALSERGKRHEIVRIVRGVRGQVAFRAECRPAFDYARAKHEIQIEQNRAVFSTPATTLSLMCPYALQADGAGAVVEFTLGPNESATFILSLGGEHHENPQQLQFHGEEALQETIALWKKWVEKCCYIGRWREMVVRSALALKLLTYAPTGAIIAAATCSLPEEIGGVRNWDYRYTWIRDSAFTINAFLRLGYTDEAAAFMNWLQQRATEPDTATGPLQTLYGVDGRCDLTEITLDHLDGYRGSKPVRIGNLASQQLQLDIYGELVDSIYLYDKNGTQISYDLWIYLRRILSWDARTGIGRITGYGKSGGIRNTSSTPKCSAGLPSIAACESPGGGGCRQTGSGCEPPQTQFMKASCNEAGARTAEHSRSTSVAPHWTPVFSRYRCRALSRRTIQECCQPCSVSRKNWYRIVWCTGMSWDERLATGCLE